MPARQQSIELKAGDILFREGDPGDRAYLVKKGCIEIFKEKEGVRIVENKLHPGEIFGEMAIIKKTPRSAGACAVQPTVLLIVSPATLASTLQKTPELIRGTVNQMLARLRAKEEKTDSVALRGNTEEKVKKMVAALQKITILLEAYAERHAQVPARQQGILDSLRSACRAGLGNELPKEEL